jgi:hypothetical protein
MRNVETEDGAAGARALGWASIGIGLAELAATRQVENLLGLDDRPTYRGILRVLGARELMHGLGILADKRPSSAMTVGLWSRVAGDALDTALLGAAARRTKHPARFAAVASMVMAIGLADFVCAKEHLSDD